MEDDQALLPPLPPEPRPPAALRLIGLVGLALALSAALAGALIMSRTDGESRPAPTAEPIIGALALRPDLVREARWPFHANGGFANAGTRGDDHAGPPLDYEHIANPSAGSAGTAVKVVEEFYERLDHDPTAATELLAHRLATGQREQFRAGWREVDTVRLLEARVRRDGWVDVEVEVGYPRGERVVLQQALRIATDTMPRIVGAELRSARHLPPR